MAKKRRAAGRAGPASTRAKISAALKGRRHSPMSASTRAKISAALKGRAVSASTRAKIAATLTARYRTGRKAAGLRHLRGRVYRHRGRLYARRYHHRGARLRARTGRRLVR